MKIETTHAERITELLSLIQAEQYMHDRIKQEAEESDDTYWASKSVVSSLQWLIMSLEHIIQLHAEFGIEFNDIKLTEERLENCRNRFKNLKLSIGDAA